MITIEHWQAHPLYRLATASYDNHDAAFALDIPGFTDWRKGWERGALLALPRHDENPVRPRYRLGHIYEFALLHELERMMSKRHAASVVKRRFRIMASRSGDAAERRAELDDGLRNIVDNNETLGKIEAPPPEVAEAWQDFGYLVDWPLLGFSPDFLDRSPERIAAPIFWVVDRDSDADEHPVPVTKVTGDTSLSGALAALERHGSPYGSRMTKRFAARVVNVTSLLAEIDSRLKVRLDGRRLKGDDE
jgi:hypothetical protein